MADENAEPRYARLDREMGHIAASKRMIRESETSIALAREALRRSSEAIEESLKRLRSKVPIR